MKNAVCRITSVLLVSAGLAWSVGAQAQTRCPMGVQAGSIQCIPDDAPSGGARSAPQPTGYWEKTWGAIAQSNANGDVGTSVRKSSEDDARKTAIRLCAQEGATDCKVQLVYHNQCAAIVSSPSGTTFQASQSKERAIRLGTENCERDGGKCEVRYSECTDPIFHRY